MTKISHQMTLTDLAGTPPLTLHVGREYVGEGFFDGQEGCWIADLNGLQYLKRLLFSVMQRYR